MSKLFSVFISILLIGCVTPSGRNAVWMNPTKDSEQVQKDSLEADLEATKYGRPFVTDNPGPSYAEIFEKVMKAKGYKLVPADQVGGRPYIPVPTRIW